MVSPSRFFTKALPARLLASALGVLAFVGSPTGTSAQAPAVAPAPKLQAAAPTAPVITPASGESTQGTMQILDLLASLSKFDGKSSAQKIGFEIPERAVN